MIPVRPADQPGFDQSVYAEDQKEYQPLPALVSKDWNVVITEWQPSAEELQRLLEGARVRLSVLVYGGQIQPMKMDVTP